MTSYLPIVIRIACFAFTTIRVGGPAGAAEEPDIVIADFEAATYGDWNVTGQAFGAGPAQGALAGQMPVAGFQGRGLVNSFAGGDATVGTLTSPEFRVERKYINFLLGGGDHPGETCINLLQGEKIVRSSTGTDSEQLEWETWDVGDLQGQLVRIEIVDQHRGGWGHINVDRIFQSAQRKARPAETAELYQESLRPQFHFTARRNWLNDPNGLVYYQGTYHLFFQHNPSGNKWGNMTWGHAVSPDLLHWRQVENALEPDKLGTIFSGSAVVDWQNTAGFQTGREKSIVCIYTSAGGTSPASQGQRFTQSIAYSNDAGRTWTKYERNPVLAHVAGENRDPKVFWHEPTRRWIMALYLEGERFALFASPDLKAWSKLSDLPALGGTECPDLFELPVEGDEKMRKWIFWGGNSNYLVGSFDGTTFTKESEPRRFEYGGNYYAAQTYSDIPTQDGRRIQIAWMSGGRYPHMPFNQQMSFPSELTLRRTAEGLRLCRRPVRELETLRGEHRAWHGTLQKDENPLAAVSGDLLDVEAQIEPAGALRITFNLRGTMLAYDVAKQELSLLGKSARLPLVGGRIELEILIDRSSIEVFAAGGEVTMSSCFVPPPEDNRLSLVGEGAKVEALDVWQLKSAVPKE